MIKIKTAPYKKGRGFIFDLPENNVLSHVICLREDKNGTLLFLSLIDNLPKLMTRKQFAYLTQKKLKEQIEFKKKTWLEISPIIESDTFAKAYKKLFITSINYRLQDLCDVLSLEEKLKILCYAESHCETSSILSEEENALFNNFNALNVFERASILVQVEALAKKQVIKK